jgi:hypothetical protein
MKDLIVIGNRLQPIEGPATSAQPSIKSGVLFINNLSRPFRTAQINFRQAGLAG